MDVFERYQLGVGDLSKNPQTRVKQLRSMIVRYQKRISFLSGQSGSTATVTRNSEDGPQPSTIKDDIRDLKEVSRKAKRELAEAKGESKLQGQDRPRPSDPNTGEKNAGKRKSKGARSKPNRGGGGGGMNLANRGRSRSMLQLAKDSRGPLNE